MLYRELSGSCSGRNSIFFLSFFLLCVWEEDWVKITPTTNFPPQPPSSSKGDFPQSPSLPSECRPFKFVGDIASHEERLLDSKNERAPEMILSPSLFITSRHRRYDPAIQIWNGGVTVWREIRPLQRKREARVFVWGRSRFKWLFAGGASSWAASPEFWVHSDEEL